MTGFRTNQKAIPHDSHLCCTLMSPSPATTWPTGSICSLWQAGHRRARVSGSFASGEDMGRHRSMPRRAPGALAASEPLGH